MGSALPKKTRDYKLATHLRNGTHIQVPAPKHWLCNLMLVRFGNVGPTREMPQGMQATFTALSTAASLQIPLIRIPTATPKTCPATMSYTIPYASFRTRHRKNGGLAMPTLTDFPGSFFSNHARFKPRPRFGSTRPRLAREQAYAHDRRCQFVGCRVPIKTPSRTTT